MPELPEVQTTVDGINEHVKGLSIRDVWTDYESARSAGKGDIKDPSFFKIFKQAVIGAKIESAARRAKNVLIRLSNGRTIIIHMKMTGHLLYGKYEKHFSEEKKKDEWIAADEGPLRSDPFNRHIRLVFSLSNGRHLALSDLRRFAKVTVAESDKLDTSKHLSESGPEPLEDSLDLPAFKERILKKPNGPIKQVLMDHRIIAGIGNIYSDEILWHSDIHPLEHVRDIDPRKIPVLFRAMKETLEKGIDFGGDSMSDYRNILGESGKFQGQHNAYRKTGKRCSKPGCGGTIRRIKVGGRSAHFCDVHQKLTRKS